MFFPPSHLLCSALSVNTENTTNSCSPFSCFFKNASFPINCPRQKVLENDSKVEEEEEEEEVGMEEEEEEVGEEEEVEVASVFKWVLVLQYIGQFTQSCHEG